MLPLLHAIIDGDIEETSNFYGQYLRMAKITVGVMLPSLFGLAWARNRVDIRWALWPFPSQITRAHPYTSATPC